MGSDWESVSLGDFCTKIGSGATPKGGSSVYQDSGEICLIRSQNIYNEGFNLSGLVYIDEVAATKLKNVEVEENDILLNITGDSVARVCLAPTSYLPARVNQHVAIIRPNPKEFDARFLRYQLASQKMQQLLLNLASAGATRNALTKGMIETFEVSKPPLNVQAGIADMLESLDNKITLNRQINQTLEQIAQTLFKSWFVDFDPVIDNALDAGNAIPDELQVRAEQRQALRNSVNKANAQNQPQSTRTNPAAGDALATPYKPLPDDLRQLFPNEFEESELGWVPKGWTPSTVGVEFDVTMGQSPPGSTYNEIGEGLPFFQGKTDFGFRYPSNRIYCTEPKRLATKQDTLISVRAPVGDINLAAEDCCIGRGLAAVKHKSGSASFTYYAMNNLSRHFEVFEGEGTVFGSINQKDFKALPQLKLPVSVIESFDRFCIQWDKKIELSSLQISNLTQIRDTLLPKLISGELRLDEVESTIAETTA